MATAAASGDTLQAPSHHGGGQAAPLVDKPLWLTSWKDQLAAAAATSSCLETCDINGDNNYKLVAASVARRLKVFSGTSAVNDSPLLDIPVGVVSYYADYSETVRLPLLAVASGQFIFMYKSLRPHYKFTLPPVELSSGEVEIWATFQKNKQPTTESEVVAAASKLESLKEAGNYLSARTHDFLALETVKEKTTFVDKIRIMPLQQQTIVTCMVVLRRDRDDQDALGNLLIGTESQRLLLLDKTGAQIQRKTVLPSVPVSLLTSGILEGEYRVVALCRDGRIYICKNGELQANVCVQSESMLTCFTRMDNHLICGTMTNHLLHFSLKGVRVAALPLPSSVSTLAALAPEAGRQPRSIIVALANSNEVRVYTGKVLVNKLHMSQTIIGLKVGRYGTEDNCLMLSFKAGTIQVMMLPRSGASAIRNATPSSANTGPPREQDTPLAIPKRTSLYVDQLSRERDYATDMFKTFNKDVCKLRLMTTRAYAKLMTDVKVGDVQESFSSLTSLRLNCSVSGLGPSFRLRVTVQNTGTQPLTGLYLVVLQGIYDIQQPRSPIPCLVPSVLYNFDLLLEAPEKCNSAGVVKVLVCSGTSQNPIVSSTVQMPSNDGLIQQDEE